jgi:hypothetical protein
MIYEKNLTILKRKRFIYFHKLLVLRNIFKDSDTKSFKLIKKVYLFRWHQTKNYTEIKNKIKISKIKKIILKSKDVMSLFKRLSIFKKVISYIFINKICDEVMKRKHKNINSIDASQLVNLI